MENLDLLKNTIIAEVLAYCDEIEPVFIREEVFSFIEIGEMFELEKRLYTLAVLKNIENEMMFSNILGKEIKNFS